LNEFKEEEIKHKQHFAEATYLIETVSVTFPANSAQAMVFISV